MVTVSKRMGEAPARFGQKMTFWRTMPVNPMARTFENSKRPSTESPSSASLGSMRARR